MNQPTLPGMPVPAFPQRNPDGRDDWATPWDLYQKLDGEFEFGLDAAASEWNHKHENYIDETDDSFCADWAKLSKGKPVWINPPYGRDIWKWMRLAREWGKKLTVVCLIFARTDTEWWSAYAMEAAEIRFIRGRLTFEPPPGWVKRDRNGEPTLDGQGNPVTEPDASPAPSCVLVFRPGTSCSPTAMTMERK